MPIGLVAFLQTGTKHLENRFPFGAASCGLAVMRRRLLSVNLKTYSRLLLHAYYLFYDLQSLYQKREWSGRCQGSALPPPYFYKWARVGHEENHLEVA